MPDSSAPSQDVDRVASALVTVLPALQRSLERHVGREFPHPRLPEGQLALLFLVEEREGVTVREAAEALLMKPNNVSALVSQLTELGLLERKQDTADKRVAHLYPTATARERLAEARLLKEGHVAHALHTLTEGELDALGAALGALTSLNLRLRASAG
ncbi:MarR family winged helix-turn-helix transcriptional regulator [Streptomyces sp. NBC_00683]|uniref:MarR family winged helix-turn-helix transcriptional regulator n=1 Tax=Streptomyces sp. NBC_00683 TaxID=2903670 RepID=UPI002E311AB5|nr:MarR family winged helix-turn-helix transcriptional regulator [Streptomyces sp. NBC_00683]